MVASISINSSSILENLSSYVCEDLDFNICLFGFLGNAPLQLVLFEILLDFTFLLSFFCSSFCHIN